MKTSSLLTLIGLLFWPLGMSVAADAPRVVPVPTKPNIIYLLIDDQGYADVGFNGSKIMHTPNIDKLANAGTILTSFYAQPVCSPTRATLMSGRYPVRTGIYNTVNPKRPQPLPLEERTLADALRAAGYETAICGKWHLGTNPKARPTKRGFDHQYGLLGGAIDNFTMEGNKGEGPSGRDWYRDDQPSADEGYSTDLITKEACRILREKDPRKPLFLYVPFNAVHTPHQSPPGFDAPYANLSKAMKNYAAMTAALDLEIGKIMATLEETGLRENTLIIYSSDNGGTSWGPAGNNAPLRGGKAEIYEGGVRLCAFVNWPGIIPAGVKIDEPVHMIDWYPTLVNLAGGSLKQTLPLDGKDIWPVLTQGAKSPHEEILIIGSVAGQRALRVGSWKLLINPQERNSKAKIEPVELYNLSDDIAESRNLAGSYPERVAEMKQRLENYLKHPANPEYFYSEPRKGRAQPEDL